MKKVLLVGTTFMFALIFAGCRNHEHIINILPHEQIPFLQYTVEGSEDPGLMYCRMQFFADGSNGRSIAIPSGGYFKMDDSFPESDSSKYTGFVYEKITSVKSFTGKHSIEFYLNGYGQHIESFTFLPIELTDKFPGILNRKEYSFSIKNFDSIHSKLRLVMTDTSFQSTNYNEIIPVYNGTFIITENMFKHLVNGPVEIELFSEEERTLSNKSSPQGHILISYSLTRNVVLSD